MKDHVEVFFHSQQPYIHVKEEDLEKYDSGRLGFPNTYFDPEKAHALYNQYHEEYQLADEAGLDGIMTNEHHAAYWNMKPSANIDAAVISRLTKKVRIAILGNIIPINAPVRMAEELAMLDCYSQGRLISGFVRGGAVETLQAGISPTENRDRFEEAHDLIIKCWTEPGPFRFEGQYYQRRVVNPWVLPIQKPHPPVWFPGGSSPESVIWAAKHQYAYMNLGALIGLTQELKQVYIDTAKEVGFVPGPKHFARQLSSSRWGGGGGPPMTYQDLQDVNAVVVGSPKTVIAKLKDTVQKLSPGYLILIGSDGNIPHKDVMRSLELLGSEVVPALHDIELQPYT